MSNILNRIFSKWYQKPVDFYRGIIELPLENFEFIMQHGRAEYIIKGGEKERARMDKTPRMIIQCAIDIVIDEYFEALGIDFKDDDLFVLMQQRIFFRQKYIDGDKSAINKIRALDQQIDDLKKLAVKTDLVKNRVAVAKWYHQPIDPKKTTVLEFVKIIEIMREETERMNAPKKTEENGDNN